MLVNYVLYTIDEIYNCGKFQSIFWLELWTNCAFYKLN